VVFVSVCSKLRALSAHVIYMSVPDLKDGKPVLQLRGSARGLDLSTAAWAGKAKKVLPVTALQVTSKTPAAAARSLALKENALVDQGGLADQAYTLVLFPESVDRGEDGWVRTVPLVIVKGVFTAQDREITPATGRVTKAEFRPPAGMTGT